MPSSPPNKSDDLFIKYLPLVYEMVDKQIRRDKNLERHRDDLIVAGMWERGLHKAVKCYDPSRCDRFKPFAILVIKQAIIEERRRLIRPKPRKIKVGLDDHKIAMYPPRTISIYDLETDGACVNDFPDDRRRTPDLSPLEQMIHAEQVEQVKKVVNPRLYPALFDFTTSDDACKKETLEGWANDLGYDLPDSLRRALDRECDKTRRALGRYLN